jgi:hypothetical protein
MNNQITLAKLAVNPLIVYSIDIPEPEKLQLTEYEKNSFPAIFGNLTGISMATCKPMYKMGRVLSFDITPRRKLDPVIIFSPIGNLKPYYSVWAEIIEDGMGSWKQKKIKKYDDSITAFLNSLKCFRDEERLSTHEVAFAIIEMLKFKNDVALNWE